MEEDIGPALAAQIIERKRKARGLSVREAARRATLSEGRWRQIAKGYQSAAQGMKVPVNAPIETLMRMARATGVQASDLRSFGEDEVASSIESQERSKLSHPFMLGRQDGASAISLIPDEVIVDELVRRLASGREAQERVANAVADGILTARREDVRNDADTKAG